MPSRRSPEPSADAQTCTSSEGELAAQHQETSVLNLSGLSPARAVRADDAQRGTGVQDVVGIEIRLHASLWPHPENLRQPQVDLRTPALELLTPASIRRRVVTGELQVAWYSPLGQKSYPKTASGALVIEGDTESVWTRWVSANMLTLFFAEACHVKRGPWAHSQSLWDAGPRLRSGS